MACCRARPARDSGASVDGILAEKRRLHPHCLPGVSDMGSRAPPGAPIHLGFLQPPLFHPPLPPVFSGCCDGGWEAFVIKRLESCSQLASVFMSLPAGHLMGAPCCRLHTGCAQRRRPPSGRSLEPKGPFGPEDARRWGRRFWPVCPPVSVQPLLHLNLLPHGNQEGTFWGLPPRDGRSIRCQAGSVVWDG